MKLKNKVAMVTGGSRGIGASIARRFGTEGAAVAITYINSKDAAEDFVREMQARDGRAIAIQADAASPEALIAAVEATVKAFGQLDILVNNAGVAHFGKIDSLRLEDFEHTYAVNVRGIFVATQAAAKYMKAGGRIVNIGSSVANTVPFQGSCAYAMSKMAVVGLTKAFARDLGARGITVNNVQPGAITTDMNPDGTDLAKILKSRTPLARYGETDEIASIVTFLVSHEASFVTGASITVDGGLTA